jgi:hypothetical protein
LCPFSAIFAPLREPVFSFFGLKNEEKDKHNGPWQLAFAPFVCQFPSTEPLAVITLKGDGDFPIKAWKEIEGASW